MDILNILQIVSSYVCSFALLVATLLINYKDHVKVESKHLFGKTISALLVGSGIYIITSSISKVDIPYFSYVVLFGVSVFAVWVLWYVVLYGLYVDYFFCTPIGLRCHAWYKKKYAPKTVWDCIFPKKHNPWYRFHRWFLGIFLG